MQIELEAMVTPLQLPPHRNRHLDLDLDLGRLTCTIAIIAAPSVMMMTTFMIVIDVAAIRLAIAFRD